MAMGQEVSAGSEVVSVEAVYRERRVLPHPAPEAAHGFVRPPRWFPPLTSALFFPSRLPLGEPSPITEGHPIPPFREQRRRLVHAALVGKVNLLLIMKSTADILVAAAPLHVPANLSFTVRLLLLPGKRAGKSKGRGCVGSDSFLLAILDSSFSNAS